ncbi:AMP-dependent synthetase/ligase [Vibrio hibernica]|uniref:AMP-dependent synthetase/ligase n=1 Tax=Vibrio hibernica TaxID=2587465 RepID=UPI00187F0849|nr:long-chain fatty acid--CoA ligase [Vibrio hibernica]
MSLELYHPVRSLYKQVQVQPAKIALEGFELAAPWDQVSWSRFDAISTKMAQVLIHFGVGIQDKCAILSDNKPQWTCADIACLKARAVVVPIYPTSTSEQARYIINDAQVGVIFVDTAEQYKVACNLQVHSNSISHIVVFDPKAALLNTEYHHHFDALISDETFVTKECETQLQQRLADAHLDDLLTLIYTSGTTGDPKGVMLDHKNIASTMRQHDEKLAFSAGDVSLAFLPLSHVFERAWSFYVLCRGGKNVYLADTNKVKEAIAQVRPNTMCVVPRFLEKVYSAVQAKVSKGSSTQQKIFAWALSVGTKHFEILQNREKGNVWLSIQQTLATKLVFSKLQQVLGGRLKFMPCGGAALDKEVASFFHAINVPVLCGYGMTETTATVTCNTIVNRVSGSNGQMLSETDVKIGEGNEVLVRGDTVMRGYYNRPIDTENAFQDGWLKTGDAGEFDANGNLYITDRIKELMKTSNGKYIAPQRVEGKVGCCPFIEQIAVIADQRNYVTALIVPAFESLEAWARDRGLQFESSIDLLRNHHVIEHFENRLKVLQQELAGFEKIKRFTLLSEAFSIEKGLITPTLKLRRKNIDQTYASEIQAMYH